MKDENTELLPCPFCGGDAEIRPIYSRGVDMSGKPPPLLSVQITHHCPRVTDADGNYPVLHHYIEVRGRDHESAFAEWNRRK